MSASIVTGQSPLENSHIFVGFQLLISSYVTFLQRRLGGETGLVNVNNFYHN